MGMGPPPKPTALKLVQGNPGKKPLNDAEPVLAVKIPEPPKQLSAAARVEWDRIAPILLDCGLLTDADRDNLGAYCEAVVRFWEAQEHLRQTGYLIRAPSGYPIQNPWYAVMQEAGNTMKSLGQEFGLSPSSRSRIRVDDQKPKDEFESYLKNRGSRETSR